MTAHFFILYSSGYRSYEKLFKLELDDQIQIYYPSKEQRLKEKRLKEKRLAAQMKRKENLDIWEKELRERDEKAKDKRTFEDGMRYGTIIGFFLAIVFALISGVLLSK